MNKCSINHFEDIDPMAILSYGVPALTIFLSLRKKEELDLQKR